MALYGKREDIELSVERASLDELPFYCVSPARFAILSLTTFGLYDLYWFYRNWQRVKVRTGRDVSPFWRAVFSPVFCYGMASAIDSAAASVHAQRRVRPGPTAAVYAGVFALEGLPDPYWLVAFLGFVPLLPLVAQIREIHERLRPGLDTEVGWSWRSRTAAVLGSSLLALVLTGLLGPPTYALPGSDVPARFEQRLREAGILESGERIDFLYSTAILDVGAEGSLLTDRRVIHYEEVEDGHRVLGAPYRDVRSVATQFSSGLLENTVITVWTAREETLVLLVSSEKGRDREFAGMLLERVPTSALLEDGPAGRDPAETSP